jgi:hypothetical protein
VRGAGSHEERDREEREAGPVDVGEDSCGTYNDPAFSGDSATIDVIDVFTASVGEELAYR